MTQLIRIGARFCPLILLLTLAWPGSLRAQSITMMLEKSIGPADTLNVAIKIKESGVTSSVAADIILAGTIDILYDPTALLYAYHPTSISHDAVYESYPRNETAFGATYGPQVAGPTLTFTTTPSRVPNPADGNAADVCNPPDGTCTAPYVRTSMTDNTLGNPILYTTDVYQTILTHRFKILPTPGAALETLQKAAVIPIDVQVDSASLAICFVNNFANRTGQCCTGTGTTGGEGEGNTVFGFCNIDNPELLPVELTDFSAVVVDGNVNLTWATASETNNAGFSIEHASGDTGGFEEIDFVDGAGTSLEPHSYTYTVKGLDIGTHRFRLKQLDYDGAFDYSETVETTIELAGTHRLGSAYPNPFNPSTTFELIVGRDQRVRIDIINALGQRVERMFDGTLEANKPTNFTFEAGTLPTGLYFYRVIGENFAQTRQVLLVK